MLLKKICILIVVPLLFSCAVPYIKEDVTNQDWQALGKHDAEQGQIQKSESYLNKLASKYNGGEVDVKAYEQAYQSALDEYCVLTNAYVLGISGKNYLGICKDYRYGDEFYRRWYLGKMAFTSPRRN